MEIVLIEASRATSLMVLPWTCEYSRLTRGYRRFTGAFQSHTRFRTKARRKCFYSATRTGDDSWNEERCSFAEARQSVTFDQVCEKLRLFEHGMRSCMIGDCLVILAHSGLNLDMIPPSQRYQFLLDRRTERYLSQFYDLQRATQRRWIDTMDAIHFVRCSNMRNFSINSDKSVYRHGL